MEFNIQAVGLQEILPWRNMYLQEINAYNRYHATHERGWADEYLINAGLTVAGYASVKGRDELRDRDAVFEFYLLPHYRSLAAKAFLHLLQNVPVKYIECQSNDALLSAMLFRLAENIEADTILFRDHTVTTLMQPGLVFRPRADEDEIFEHLLEPPGEYVLDANGEIVATGGFMTHYNFPFADLYMEVNEKHYRKGYGSFLVQELKKLTYSAGRVPGARCSIKNVASRACLIRAGFAEAGFMLCGTVREGR